ncbi:DUF3892 domain-containing protein [Myxococcus sp. CA040A]|uniref:DUF3892 domain-containing protein n=1 Tax=Myxococcus sp. CA040A TaxID=2741738 RepID=UPI00157A872C|nr:DUF3892 domain-containing protein [Myxococcus sp. CA040A]NTX01829.1 DUF3892 domain-containing protein [Myxococcus sp. CA040A]
MKRYITGIRLSGGTGLEHITEFRWDEGEKGQRDGQSSRPVMVQWVQSGNSAFVKAKPGVDVRVVPVNANPPYLRTEANETTTDNLLKLPHF